MAEPAPEGEALTTELERLRLIEEAWKIDQRHLHDQGFQTLDALTSAWAADRKALNALQSDAIAQSETLASAPARITELEAQVAAPPTADADAPAKPKAKAGKAADTAET